MISATLPVSIALLIQLTLAVVVLQSNRKRRANQCFSIVSLLTGFWLATLYLAFHARTEADAELAIREASVAGILVLASLDLLRLSILYPSKPWRAIFYRFRYWILFSFGVAILCHTKWFLKGARLPPALGLVAPESLYGNGGYLYAACLTAAIVVLFRTSLRDWRKAQGGQRAELAFSLIGALVIYVITLLVYQVLRFFVDPTQSLWLAPFRVVLFSAVVAYGIATRKVMEVGVVIRRVISYSLVALYLLALYGGVWWLVEASCTSLGISRPITVAHIAAALVIAFAMAPARGLSQSLADRLFVRTGGLDFRATVSKAAAILGSVTTLDDLLVRFAATIGQAVGTDSVSILLLGRNEYAARSDGSLLGESAIDMRLAVDGPIPTFLRSQREPVILDELYRVRSTPEVASLISELKRVKSAAAISVFSRDQLVALMLLGPRLSGRIYGSVEQSALQVLSGQLAVAIENAKLFTEVQNAKIYNDILLQNLTTGVIAADADGQITVFNKEAALITGVEREEILDRNLESLPEELRVVLQETIDSRERKEHHEVMIRSDEGSSVVRISSSIFHDQQGQMLGVLIVFTDITALKRLELQIRRSDRLASLGTLSAGMAHEIKNPLVSIKTFAQLLPERYNDSDFRDTFSKLIGHEIDRIDSLVNQLLRFARPAKPLLKPMHVHDVLEKSLMLVQHRLYQKEVTLNRDWNAKVDTIRADSDQIEQVFLNFFLNAMEAMKPGGRLTVETEIAETSEDDWAGSRAGNNGDPHELLRISICDTGEGIRAEDIPHVFDPFFTTKDYGTGLGLSVVHGIIEEHGGQIEVESEVAKGTTFHILLPLTRIEREVVAA